KGTSMGSTTDIDGNFQITNIPEGTYTLVITYVGYETKEIPDLKVEGGKAIVINTTIIPENQTIGQIEVVGKRETGTTIAVIAEIKEAEQVAVGIGSEQIQKTQDRDAAQVLRRIPGVSLQENRFAIIRGLPQRYNAVMINDIYAPSTEVDTRAFSFDLVPSNMIDRVLIFKSGAAELPGDFAGGAVRIFTKTAPEENFTNVSIGYGFRTNTTLEQVEDYQGSKTDFLGFDDGLRRLPANYPSFISNSLSPVERAKFAHSLTSDLSFRTKRVLPDIRLSYNMGRRFRKGSWQVANLTAINYGNTHQYYDAEFNNFLIVQPFPPPKSASFVDATYTNFYRLGVLHNWTFVKNADNRIEFKTLFNQQSFKQSLIRRGGDIINTVDNQNYSQRFEQKSFFGSQLFGKHNFGEKINFTWIAGFNYTNKKEPDWRRLVTNRRTGATLPDGSPAPFQLSIPGSGNLFDGRYFSNLNEFAYSASLAFEQKLKANEEEKLTPKIRYGVYTELKNRDFKARYFSYLVSPTADPANIQAIKEQPLSQIFRPENVDGINGLTFVEGTSSVDSYDANNFLVAPYVGAYIPLKKFSITPGVRLEYNIQEINTLNLSGTPEGARNPILSILPSLNMTYNLTDKSLIRLAYSRSVNRPEFRELAPFIFYDFNLNASITGNSRLKVANIDNADFRWEYYPSAAELISVGTFYKRFTNPIENYLQNNTGGAGTNNFAYSFGNAVEAQAYGVEAEIRKQFYGSPSKFLQNLGVVANASFLISRVNVGRRVDLGPSVGIVDVDAPENRTLVGQSPYLVNFGLYYNDEDKGLQVNALYNVAGPRLFLVGNFNTPSFYENQRHIIDFNIAKTFAQKYEIRFTVQDILNQKFRVVQDVNLNAKIDREDGDIKAFRPGSNYFFTFTYKF
ncbi:MAG: TonB-dependent receptor, partial [Raineya sp.]|nr:TonB-dependent receptor [Raineya sp.]